MIKSDIGHGIKASDNLTIEEGTIEISAARDGINVNDTFKMTGGDVNIDAVYDGINSDSIAIIEGGNLNIKTTAEPTNISDISNMNNSAEKDQNTPMRSGFMQESTDVEFESSAKGIKADWMMVISGGNIIVNSTDHAIHCADEIEISGGVLSLNSEYCKGISGHGNVTISGKDTVIDITKSTEGIESKNVLTINNGNLNIVSSDDTLNGTGGNSGDKLLPQGNTDNRFTPPENIGEDFTLPEKTDKKTPQMRENLDSQDMAPPENISKTEKNAPMQKPDGFGGKGGNGENGKGMRGANLKDTIIINCGNLELCSTNDDVIDANGNIVINGGVIKATLSNGGIVSFTGVLDADGSVTIGENATLITATRSGATPTLSDTQNAVVIYTTSEHSAENTIFVKSKDGEVLAEYAPKGNFQTVFIVSPKIESGKTYTISIGDEEYNATMSGGVVTIGEAQTGMGGFGGAIPGGRQNRTPKTLPTNE